MIKKLTISSLIITIILGVCALITAPFAVKNQLALWEKEYGQFYHFETSKKVSVEGIKYVNISSHQNNRIFGRIYQTNDKEIKIYYEGFSIANPLITENKEGETLDLQIDLEQINENQKNILFAALSHTGYLEFRIYVPKDLNITLYTDNFNPINTDFSDVAEIMTASGNVYGEEYVVSSQEYYYNLKLEYGINNLNALSASSTFEKLNYIAKDFMEDFDDNTIERPTVLTVKDKFSDDIATTVQRFANENSDICPTPEAKEEFITCATTYINIQLRLSLSAIHDNCFDEYLINNYNEDPEFYSSQIKSDMLQFFQAKEDLMQSIQTTILSRKNDIISMLTFI